MCLPLKRRLQNTTSKAWSFPAIAVILLVWQCVTGAGLVAEFMLPSPAQVFTAFVKEFPALMDNAGITLAEAAIGLFFGVAIGFGAAVLMDHCERLYKAFYPIVVLTQTVPAVAIAPLLVLWFGYEMTPKIVLIVITTFFPITVGLLTGFKAADADAVNLLKAMGAGKVQIFRYIKLPGAIGQFFSGLRISATYAVVGAVIAEWLGGFGGLGVYMTRVRKAYAIDKMFAVIFLISVISLLLIWIVDRLQKKCMPWEAYQKK